MVSSWGDTLVKYLNGRNYKTEVVSKIYRADLIMMGLVDIKVETNHHWVKTGNCQNFISLAARV